MVQHVRREHDVEGVAGDWQMLDVRIHASRVSDQRQHALREVDCDSTSNVTPVAQQVFVDAVAAPDVEHGARVSIMDTREIEHPGVQIELRVASTLALFWKSKPFSAKCLPTITVCTLLSLPLILM